MHEVVKQCGRVEVSEVLIGALLDAKLSKDALRELNLRLTILILQLRDNPGGSVQYAFAQAATASLASHGLVKSAVAGGKL